MAVADEKGRRVVEERGDGGVVAVFPGAQLGPRQNTSGPDAAQHPAGRQPHAAPTSPPTARAA
jgi:hypothetical protein